MDIIRFAEEQRRILAQHEATARLARATAHEINNILQSLTVHLYYARESAADNERILRDIVDAEKSAAQLQTLANHLRSIGRPADVVCVPISMDEWLPRAVANWQARHKDAPKVDIESVPGALPVIQADSLALQGTLDALLDNAVQFGAASPPQIRLSVDIVQVDESVGDKATSMGGRVFVRATVANDGPRMSADVRAHACDPYFTTRDTQRSHGQGLATALRACRAMGGFLHIHETAQGARVSMFLPTAAEPEGSAGFAIQPLSRVLSAEG